MGMRCTCDVMSVVPSVANILQIFPPRYVVASHIISKQNQDAPTQRWPSWIDNSKTNKVRQFDDIEEVLHRKTKSRLCERQSDKLPRRQTKRRDLARGTCSMYYCESITSMNRHHSSKKSHQRLVALARWKKSTLQESLIPKDPKLARSIITSIASFVAKGGSALILERRLVTQES